MLRARVFFMPDACMGPDAIEFCDEKLRVEFEGGFIIIHCPCDDNVNAYNASVVRSLHVDIRA